MEHVLIIKHGALGDFVMDIGAILFIRDQHPGAHFTLMTSSPFVSLGKQLDMFDDYIIDNRKGLSSLGILRQVLRGCYTHVYDLQCRPRTLRYRTLLRLMWPAGTYEWYMAKDIHDNRPRKDTTMHYTIRKKHRFGIGTMTAAPWGVRFPVSDISFLQGKAEHFDMLPERFVLFIPGCSARNAYKRWPVQSFIEIAARLAKRGIKTVVIGTKAESEEISAICQSDPENIVNMMGLTGLMDIPQIALRALCTIGNDTGPSHMASLSGAPAIGLYDKRTGHARLMGPRSTSIVSDSTIDLITPEQVWEALLPRIS